MYVNCAVLELFEVYRTRFARGQACVFFYSYMLAMCFKVLADSFRFREIAHKKK